MVVVGLTGGAATGKSTVARILAGMGVPVVDADQAARIVVEPGRPALDAIVATFGRDVLGPDGTLDRAAMRRRIVADPDARRKLEAITHPAIRAHLAAALDALRETGHDVVVVEAALLVETGSYRDYPVLVVVSCAPETQLRRLVERDGLTTTEAEALLRAQLPVADKEAVATHVIRNDGDLAALEREVRRVWALIRP